MLLNHQTLSHANYLGGGEAIGTELAKALKTYTQQIRTVSRTPEKVNDTDEIFAADLTSETAVSKAIEGYEEGVGEIIAADEKSL